MDYFVAPDYNNCQIVVGPFDSFDHACHYIDHYIHTDRYLVVDQFGLPVDEIDDIDVADFGPPSPVVATPPPIQYTRWFNRITNESN